MFRISVSETYAIEDCWKYVGTEQTVSHGSSGTTQLAQFQSATDYEISLTVTYTGSANFLLATSELTSVSNNAYGFGKNVSNFYGFTKATQYSAYSSPFTLKMVREGTTITTYLNNTQLESYTSSYVDDYLYLLINSWNASATFKYNHLKIKPL